MGWGVLDGRGAGWMDRLCVLIVFDLCGVLSGPGWEIQGDERFYRLRYFFGIINCEVKAPHTFPQPFIIH